MDLRYAYTTVLETPDFILKTISSDFKIFFLSKIYRVFNNMA